MKRTAWMTVALAALGTSAFAQGGYQPSYSGPKVELTFWNGQDGDNRVYVEELVKKYNAQSKNVVVKMTTQPQNTIAQQLPALVAGGRAPDLTSFIETVTIQNGVRGVIEELTPSVLASAKLDKARFYPSLWDGAVYQGKVYGIPVYNVAFAMFYNKDLMQKMGVAKVPETRDEFLKAAQQCTTDKSGKKPGEAGFNPASLNTWGVGVQSGFYGATLTYSLALQNGGNTVNDQYAPNFTSPEVQEAVQFATDLVKKHHVSPANLTYDGELAGFRAGKQCFSIVGSWLSVNYAGQKNLKFGVAPLPQLGGKSRSFWGGSGYMVLPKQRANYDKNKRAAALDFTNFFTAPENNAYFAAKGGTLPTGPGAAQDKAFDASPFRALFSSLKDVHIEAGFPWVDQVRGAYITAWDAALSGKKPIPAALKDGQAEADKLVQQAQKNLR